MKPMSEAALAPDEVLIGKMTAIVEALVGEALRDQVYCEALFLAAGNLLGFRSVTHSVPLDELIGRLRQVAATARQHAERQFLQ